MNGHYIAGKNVSLYVDNGCPLFLMLGESTSYREREGSLERELQEKTKARIMGAETTPSCTGKTV